jgi:hypothetical protein
MENLNEFFNAADSLTTVGILLSAELDLDGFFDVNDSEFFLDDSQSEERAQYVTQYWENCEAVNGDTLSVDNKSYRVVKVQPDGTGLVTLHLFKV